jgi:hypothetical protein
VKEREKTVGNIGGFSTKMTTYQAWHPMPNTLQPEPKLSLDSSDQQKCTLLLRDVDEVAIIKSVSEH